MMRFTTFVFAVLVCCGEGSVAFTAQAGSSSAPAAFEVASIKKNAETRGGWKLTFTPNGFEARGVTLKQLVQEAFGIYEENCLQGGPSWIDTERFDIDARVDTAGAVDFASLSLEQRRAMLQALLASRFQARIRTVIEMRPIFELAIGEKGPKMAAAGPEDEHPGEIKGMDGLVVRSDRGFLEVKGLPMAGLARLLGLSLGVPVADRTGLTGQYNFSLRWTPQAVSGVQGSGEEDDGVAPYLPLALEQQLGLRLRAGKGPVTVLVVDGARMPSAN